MNERDDEKRFTFAVEGMTCASCVRIVERNLNKINGVHFVSVNLATEKAYVITDRDVTFDHIKNSVDKTGYRAVESARGDEKLEKDFSSAYRNMVVSLIFMMPLTVLMFLHMTGLHMPWFLPLEVLSGAVVILWPGRGVFRSSYIAAVHGHANMDTMVALGAIASWADYRKTSNFAAPEAKYYSLHPIASVSRKRRAANR